jgi:hypothetical protein
VPTNEISHDRLLSKSEPGYVPGMDAKSAVLHATGVFCGRGMRCEM